MTIVREFKQPESRARSLPEIRHLLGAQSVCVLSTMTCICCFPGIKNFQYYSCFVGETGVCRLALETESLLGKCIPSLKQLCCFGMKSMQEIGGHLFNRMSEHKEI